MTDYVAPGLPGSKATFKARYDHWIGGEYVKPQSGQYFENVTPVTGKVFCEIARGNAADIDKALDAAHKAAPAWERHLQLRARSSSTRLQTVWRQTSKR